MKSGRFAPISTVGEIESFCLKIPFICGDLLTFRIVNLIIPCDKYQP